MAEGLAIFGGVSAAWSLAKDVRSFVKKLERAGCDIKDLDLRFNDDVRRLSHCKTVLFSFEYRLPKIDARHLRQLARKIKRVAADLKRSLDSYFRGCPWSRLIWATHGSSISKAEVDLSFWITRLRAAITDYGLFDLSNTPSDRTLCSDDSPKHGRDPEAQIDDASGSQTLVTRMDRDLPRHGKRRETNYVDLHAMRDEIQAAMLSNGGAPSVSRLATTTIIAKFGLRSIIQNDKSLSTRLQTPEETLNLEEFALSIESKAQVLLGICVYVTMDLSFLKELLDYGFSDNDLPLSTSILRQCGMWSRAKIDNFGKWQHVFAPSWRPEDSSLYEQRILLNYDDGPQSAILPTISNSSTVLGKGSFGTVYQVSIDPEHHIYTPREECKFAMKVFHTDARSAVYYQQEVDALRELSKAPSSHIARCLATCIDANGQCAILYPKADMDLRQMLDQKPPGIGSSYNMAFLIQQMGCLAHALRYLHSRNIRHRDIKPSNILLMNGSSDTQRKTTTSQFVWSDFGLSINCNSTNLKAEDIKPGTRVYGAPEAYLEGRRQDELFKSSRNYDMWSLGCVFLEVLFWVFSDSKGLKYRPLRVRLNDDMPASNEQLDAFWYKDLHGNPQLRPSVTAAMETICENSLDSPEVISMVSLVQKLLEIDPEKRLDAEQVVTGLPSITSSQEEDAMTDDTCNQHWTPPERPSTAPYISTPPLQTRSPYQRSFWLPWRRKACKRDRGPGHAPERYKGGEDLRDHTEISNSSTSTQTTRRRRQQPLMKSPGPSSHGPCNLELTSSSPSSRMTRRRREYLLAQQEI